MKDAQRRNGRAEVIVAVRFRCGIALSMALSVALSVALILAACSKAEAPVPQSVGTASRGPELLAQYGCNSCHNIPGVEGPKGSLGPSLEHTASKPAIAGKFPNTPDTMARWLENPQSLDPQATMPNLGVPAGDAREMAAYLFTLK